MNEPPLDYGEPTDEMQWWQQQGQQEQEQQEFTDAPIDTDNTKDQ